MLTSNGTKDIALMLIVEGVRWDGHPGNTPGRCLVKLNINLQYHSAIAFVRNDSRKNVSQARTREKMYPQKDTYNFIWTKTAKSRVSINGKTGHTLTHPKSEQQLSPGESSVGSLGKGLKYTGASAGPPGIFT